MEVLAIPEIRFPSFPFDDHRFHLLFLLLKDRLPAPVARPLEPHELQNLAHVVDAPEALSLALAVGAYHPRQAEGAIREGLVGVLFEGCLAHGGGVGEGCGNGEGCESQRNEISLGFRLCRNPSRCICLSLAWGFRGSLAFLC